VPKNQKQSQSQQAVDTPLPPQLRNCQSLWEFGIIPKEHVKQEREREREREREHAECNNNMLNTP